MVPADDEALEDGLCPLDEKEHRGMANMIEMTIRDYCERNGGSYHYSPCCPLGILGTNGF